MSAIHGKNARIYLNETDITEFSKSVTLDTSNDVVDVTVFNNHSKKYIDGLKDATLSVEGTYDDDKDKIDKALDDMQDVENIISYYPANDTRGNNGFVMKSLRSASATNVSITEDVNFSLAGQTTEGVTRIKSLLAKTTISADGTTPSLDLGSGGTSAIISYHVFDLNLAGGVDIIIQDSEDNNTFATFTTINITGVDSNILTVIDSINRYVRVSVSGLGVSEDITLQIGIKKI